MDEADPRNDPVLPAGPGIDDVIDREGLEETIGGDRELLGTPGGPGTEEVVAGGGRGETIGGARGLVDPLGEGIRRNIPPAVAGVRQAIAEGDADGLRERAPRLKGSLVNFHAAAAAQAAFRLE